MSRSTYCEWPFECNNDNCEVQQVTRYKWSSDENQEHCSKCGEELRLHIPVVPETPMIITSNFKNKGRPKVEQRSRRLSHFKKDVYDTLPMWERKHFAKKNGWSLDR